jgi:hypothetical protein
VTVGPIRTASARVLLVLAVVLAAAACSAAAAASPAAPAPADPGLTVRAVPATPKYGDTVRIAVHLAVPGAVLQLSRTSPGDAAYTPVQTLVADAAGDASWEGRALRTAAYRVEFAGDSTWSGAIAEVPVSVRARVSLSTTAGALVHAGDRVTVNVGVAPAEAAAPLTIQEWDDHTGSWRALASLTLDARARVRWVWRPQDLGRHRLRARLDGSAESPVAVSGVRSVQVYDPSDHYGVPASYPHLILVDLSQYHLYYYENGRVIRSFDCVLGRPSLPTPRGHFRIYAKDPDMYGAYGPRRMRYLGAYAIHGTNEPWLLSRWPRNYSHGCTRLANANILWLYDRVPVGTPVWNVP